MRVLVLYKHKHIGRFWICISVSLITKIMIVFLNRVFQWTISRYVKSDHFHCFNFIYWTFAFLQRNTKIHSCTQTSIRFSHRNTKFRIVPFILWLRNTKFLKLFRNGHLIFANNLTNLKLRPNCYSFFLPRNAKSEFVLKRPFVFWLQTNENGT